MFIIEDELKELGLKVIQGNKLENTKEENLSEELAKVKLNNKHIFKHNISVLKYTGSIFIEQ